MNEHVSPIRRTFAGPYTYSDRAGKAGRCHLQIYEAAGALPLVLATEIAGNRAQPVIYAAGHIASQVWHALLPQAQEGLRFIAAYRAAGAQSSSEPSFAEVSLAIQGLRLKETTWREMGRAEVERLIGGPVSVPVMRGCKERASGKL